MVLWSMNKVDFQTSVADPVHLFSDRGTRCGSALEITDPDPAFGERFLRVLFPLLGFP